MEDTVLIQLHCWGEVTYELLWFSLLGSWLGERWLSPETTQVWEWISPEQDRPDGRKHQLTEAAVLFPEPACPRPRDKDRHKTQGNVAFPA